MRLLTKSRLHMTLAVGGINKSAAFNYNAADVTHLKLHQSLSTFGHHDHIAEREHFFFFIKSPALSIYRYAKTKAHISVTMLFVDQLALCVSQMST